jgi:hypothetical protein
MADPDIAEALGERIDDRRLILDDENTVLSRSLRGIVGFASCAIVID